MLIKVDCEIALAFQEPAAVVLMLRVRPRAAQGVCDERLGVDPPVPISDYLDVYGNRCARVFVPAGRSFFRHEAVVADGGQADPQVWGARHHPVQDLPAEVLLFLLPSRYCEVDSELKDWAWTTFGHGPAGWPLVRAVCDFVHNHIRFDYSQARANRTTWTRTGSGSACAGITPTWRLPCAGV